MLSFGSACTSYSTIEHPSMAPPADLREIGLEGFALIDRFYGAPAPRTRRPNNKGVFPARHGRWVVQDEMEEPAMNSKEVAARFGGIMAVNYFKGKPQIRCGTGRPIRA